MNILLRDYKGNLEVLERFWALCLSHIPTFQQFLFRSRKTMKLMIKDLEFFRVMFSNIQLLYYWLDKVCPALFPEQFCENNERKKLKGGAYPSLLDYLAIHQKREHLDIFVVYGKRIYNILEIQSEDNYKKYLSPVHTKWPMNGYLAHIISCESRLSKFCRRSGPFLLRYAAYDAHVHNNLIKYYKVSKQFDNLQLMLTFNQWTVPGNLNVTQSFDA
jgi:hypothetical protein